MDLLDDHAVFKCGDCDITNTFDRPPRALSCGHVFCQDCLKNLTERHSDKSCIVCSTCEKEAVVTKCDHEQLAENFESMSLCQAKEENGEIVREKRVTWMSNGSACKNLTCDLHGNTDIERWCRECKSLLCHLCVDKGHHLKHDTDDIENYLKEAISEITVKSGVTKSKSDEYQRKLRTLERVITETNTVKDKIKQVGDLMKMVIDKKVEGLLKLCEKEYMAPASREKSELEEQLERMSELDKKLSKCECAECLSSVYQLLPCMKEQLSRIEESAHKISLDGNAMPLFKEGTKACEITVGEIIPFFIRHQTKGGDNTETNLSTGQKSDVPNLVVPQITLKDANNRPRFKKPQIQLLADLELCTDLVNTEGARIVGLPDGGALLVRNAFNRGQNNTEILRLDSKGELTRQGFRKGAYVSALLLQGDYLLVLEVTGRITRRALDALKKATHTWNVDVNRLEGGAVIATDTLALIDSNKGEAFTYSLLQHPRKEVKVRGLDGPSCIASCSQSDDVYIAIGELGGRRSVLVYNASWKLLSAIKTDTILCCVFLPSGNLLIPEGLKRQVSEWTRQKDFVRYWINRRDGISDPLHASFSVPYLWVLTDSGKVYRCKIFKD